MLAIKPHYKISSKSAEGFSSPHMSDFAHQRVTRLVFLFGGGFFSLCTAKAHGPIERQDDGPTPWWKVGLH